MKGFDPKFVDFPDYILGITHEIWEERKVETLNDYYAPEIVVRSPGSVVVGNQAVIAATHATLEEFPDRQLLGEDVIWSGTPDDGMLSSHRILTTATHQGDGVYGSATGTKLVYRVIAECHAKNNQIDDEWLVRDQGAIVRQLGYSPEDYARNLIASEGGPNACVQPYTAANDIKGPYVGTGNSNEWGQNYADILTRVMGGESKAILDSYDRAAALEYPSGVRAESFDGAIAFWVGLRSSFPDAEFSIQHIIGREDPLMPPRAALRWTLHGKHSGNGLFGTPSGAEVYILGLCHAEFGALVAGRPRLRREWVVFDETAIWKQILLRSGSV